MKRLLLVLIMSLSLFSLQTTAIAYCSEPSSEPWCLSDDDTFRDRSDFDGCRWQVESYVDDAEEYVSCVRREIDELKRKQAEAIELANEAVRRFNCGAERGEACW